MKSDCSGRPQRWALLIQKPRAELLGVSGEWLLHSPSSGNKPQRAPEQRPRTCLIIKQTGNTFPDCSKLEEFSALAMRGFVVVGHFKCLRRDCCPSQPVAPVNLPVTPGAARTSARLLLVHATCFDASERSFDHDEQRCGLLHKPSDQLHGHGLVRGGYAVISVRMQTLLYCQEQRVGDLLVSAQCLTHITILRHEIR